MGVILCIFIDVIHNRLVNMSRFFGIHMFNPPYTLNLCELTPTKYSDGRLKEELKEYLGGKLYRTVVEVKDSPAFLGNRIGFQFINEALQCISSILLSKIKSLSDTHFPNMEKSAGIRFLAIASALTDFTIRGIVL